MIEFMRLSTGDIRVDHVVQATKLLKEAGIKVYYHWMPGLPGSNLEHDLELSRMLFEDQRFRPDGLKLYPTLVIANTELLNWYEDGRYQPYTRDETVELLARIKSIVPEVCKNTTSNERYTCPIHRCRL